VEYEDDDLRRLAEDASFTQKRWGRDVVRAYRKKIQILLSSMDERDLRNVKSLRLEKLRGDREGQRSIRLNDQFRLILKFRTEGDRLVIVVEIVDYH
jgi:proteic killer suppression protein